MIDNKTAEKYLAQCCDSLRAAEADLLDIRKDRAKTRKDLVTRVFRTLHSVIGAVMFFDVPAISKLAGEVEDVLVLMGSRNLFPGPEQVDVLLRAVTRLQVLMQNPDASGHADIAESRAELNSLCAYLPSGTGNKSSVSPVEEIQGGRQLRALVIEDDVASLFFLQSFLSGFGSCRIAANGKKALDLVRSALEQGQHFDLICLDIMMPGMDGREALRQIRALEEIHGKFWMSGARIIMTTAVDDINEVIPCFQEFCDSYLLKPIDLDVLLERMKFYQLVSQ